VLSKKGKLTLFIKSGLMQNRIKNETILITGGAGFIGSHLIEKLISIGYRVICIDNFDNFYARIKKENNIEKIRYSPEFCLIEGDIRDKKLIENIFSVNTISLVIHLAAKAGVRPSIHNPCEYFDVNVNGTLNLLETMKKFSVQKLIFASSSSIYGNNSKIPYSESDNVDFPISPYAASKKSGELLTYTYHHLYKFNVISLRFFTVYGPRQRPDLAIYKFFKNIKNKQPIDVYGDGSTSRDYTYIDDIVEGICGSIVFLNANSKVHEIINLGNYNPICLSDLIKLIEQITGKQFLINYVAMQPGDVILTHANIDKAQRLINYNPKNTIEEGLIKFNKWFDANC